MRHAGRFTTIASHLRTFTLIQEEDLPQREAESILRRTIGML